MRYQNWDVLIFPEGSKVPIQEFKTQCFVIRDSGDPTFLSHHSPGTGRECARLPVLTTFIPSMTPDAQFRISIHCWDSRPKESKTLESLMQVDDIVAFEARVYIDGVLVAGNMMSQHTAWPYVIEQSVLLDRDGQPAPLKFPAFRQEILHQRHWDAGELLGRIRLVIAEGFHHPKRPRPFEHVQDTLAFSFQHAPLHILEFSGIAWPNQGMWNSRIPPYSRQVLPRNENEDLHAHSPTRRQDRHSDHRKRRSSGLYAKQVPPLNSWNFATSEMAFGGPSNIPWHVAEYLRPMKTDLVDPFIDAGVGPLNTTRGLARDKTSTTDDVSMPDYATSMGSSDKANSRTISHMSGISMPSDHGISRLQGSEDPVMNELSEMYKAFSPNKVQTQGTTAPRNTPATAASLVDEEKGSSSVKGPKVVVQGPALVDGAGDSSSQASEGKRKRTSSDTPNDWEHVNHHSGNGSAVASTRKVSRLLLEMDQGSGGGGGPLGEVRTASLARQDCLTEGESDS